MRASRTARKRREIVNVFLNQGTLPGELFPMSREDVAALLGAAYARGRKDADARAKGVLR